MTAGLKSFGIYLPHPSQGHLHEEKPVMSIYHEYKALPPINWTACPFQIPCENQVIRPLVMRLVYLPLISFSNPDAAIIIMVKTETL